MKKFSIILLALTLILSLAACGGSDDNKTSSSSDEASKNVSVDESEESSVESSAADITEESSAADISEESSVADITEESSVADITEESSEDVVLTKKGVIDGNVYTNENITFTKPDAWVYYTDDQLAATFGIAADSISAENFDATLSTTANVYAMMVLDPIGGSNVNILYENLSVSGAPADEAQYIDALKAQLTAASQGTFTVGETTTKTIAGETYYYVPAAVISNGVIMTQAYCLRNIDGYMFGIIITAVGETTPDDIIAMIS